jgi:hypothetical protein
MPFWSSEHVQNLWEVYLADVDPCLKLVEHQYVEDSVMAYPAICRNQMALLMAIVFATTACKRRTPTVEYQDHARALEKALQSAEVLTRPSIPTLQALTIYLSCGRLNMDQQYLEAMLLLLVQSAIKLLLDQDPLTLGYAPAECENRRRLWWHIVTLDLRTAEACDSRPRIVSKQINTKMPSSKQTNAQDSTNVRDIC